MKRDYEVFEAMKIEVTVFCCNYVVKGKVVSEPN
jgi:hypothetical protein